MPAALRHQPDSNRGLLILGGWLAISGVFLTLLVTGWLGTTGTVALDDYASWLAPLAGAIACLHRATRDRSLRTGWRLLGGSLLSWSAGSLVWTIYEVHLGLVVPFPSFADAGYLLSVPLAVAAVIALSGSGNSLAADIRPVLDGVIAAGALLFVSWATVLGPAFHAGDTAVFADAVAVAYPASDVLIATIALLAVARSRGGQRRAITLIAVGLFTVAIADSSFTWFTAHGSYAAGNLFDTGYIAGFLLIGVAAYGPVTDPVAYDGQSSPGRATVLPYLPLAVCIPLAVSLQITGHPVGSFLFYDGLLVVAAILGRQLLSLRSNSALSRQLSATVDEVRHREVELQHQAFHDPLTGLANRALFADRVDHALARRRRPGPVSLLLADLDDFKAVNDTLGHPAGDTLLVAVAERLRAAVRPEDTVARLGGDEFAVLLEDAHDAGDACTVAERIAQALEHPFNLSGNATVMSASIGIAVAVDGANGEELLRDADVAMYEAKRLGRGGYTVYAADIATAAMDRLMLKNDLSTALVEGQLSLLYQPIVSLQTGHVTGVEALIRWRHPRLGPIAPTVFVPLAEDSGAILPIGRWVVAQACADAASWLGPRPDGLAPIHLNVNVSGRQLDDRHLVEVVAAALSRNGLPPNRLTLEITESVLLEDDTPTMVQLQALRSLGVHLAIDDFGTGYSALSRLRRYPINTLKIDKSFIDDLAPRHGPPDVVVGAIVALGHGLGMQVVAEGIETEDQMEVLRSLGCQSGQGFLFARPAEADVITELLNSGIRLVDPDPARIEHGFTVL